MKNDRIWWFSVNLEWEMGFFREIGGLALIIFLSLACLSRAFGGPLSIVGNWQTIDHDTGRPSSIIRIWEQGGKFSGRVEKIYSEHGHKAAARCEKCKGKLHNKPLLGLTIIHHLVFRKGQYVSGRILNPNNGKIYHCLAKVSDHGKRLKLRGYIGVPLFGRTDTWYRASNHIRTQ